MPRRSGFTLIELLIVLAILALLAAIGLVAYNTVLKNARDAKRQSDLALIRSALEAYNTDQKYYPASIDGTSITNTTGTNVVPITVKTYLNQVPLDPKDNSSYLYESYKSDGALCKSDSANLCVKYCLYAQGENTRIHSPNCADRVDSGYKIDMTSP